MENTIHTKSDLSIVCTQHITVLKEHWGENEADSPPPPPPPPPPPSSSSSSSSSSLSLSLSLSLSRYPEREGGGGTLKRHIQFSDFEQDGNVTTALSACRLKCRSSGTTLSQEQDQMDRNSGIFKQSMNSTD